MPDRLLFMLSRIQNRLTSHIKNELKKESIALSPGQIGILLVLDRVSQTTMGNLSQALYIDNAAITRLVDKLERQKLVERRINPEDRRQMLITITEDGLGQAGIIKKIAKAANSKIKDGFTEKEIEIYKQVNQAILKKFKS
jgi:DNA-binding MarR family transcriptional regulator